MPMATAHLSETLGLHMSTNPYEQRPNAYRTQQCSIPGDWSGLQDGPTPIVTTEPLGIPSIEDDDSALSPLGTTPSPPSSRFSSPRRPLTSPLTERSSSDLLPPSSPEDLSRATLCPPRSTHCLDLNQLEDLDQQMTLDCLVEAIRTKQNIVVVAGAGISVSAGIPDFRSPAGFFKSLKAQDLFDASVYRDDTLTIAFHEMVCSLSILSESANATPFHHLLARLAYEGRLLRLYSQNVDSIDTSLPPLATHVPLESPWPITVQLHGSVANMVCCKCFKVSSFQRDLFHGPIPPDCKQCQQEDLLRTEVAGKRSHGVGKLRPRMALYNEQNPDEEAIGAVVKADLRKKPDCIIVVGTTLKVLGVQRIVREMCSIVRDRPDGLSVWVNSDLAPPKKFDGCWDMIVKGTSDEVAKHAALWQWDEAAPGATHTREAIVIADNPTGYAKHDISRFLRVRHSSGGKQALVEWVPLWVPTADLNADETLRKFRDLKDGESGHLEAQVAVATARFGDGTDWEITQVLTEKVAGRKECFVAWKPTWVNADDIVEGREAFDKFCTALGNPGRKGARERCTGARPSGKRPRTSR